jgi:cytochrome c oxidase assembly factor CtaG
VFVCVWHSHLLCLLNSVGNGIDAEGMKHLSVGMVHVKQLNNLNLSCR